MITGGGACLTEASPRAVWRSPCSTNRLTSSRTVNPWMAALAFSAL